MGAPVLSANFTKPPRPEAFQPVAFAEGLADALDAFGEDAHGPPLGQQTGGILGRCADCAQPVEERPEEGGVRRLGPPPASADREGPDGCAG